MEDERQGLTFDYSKKKDLVHSEIIFPEGAPAWMQDRSKLWNAIEMGERRKDAQIYREIELALPNELNKEQRIELTREFVRENFVSKGMVADINLHRSDHNPHAHVLLTMRRIEGDGFGQKERDWNQKALVPQWRQRWAETQNRHLSMAGHDITVDHRSKIDQGINIEPQIKLGPHSKLWGQDSDRVDELHRIMRENGEKIIADPYVALKDISYQKALFTDADIKKYVNSHSDDAEQFKRACESIYKCDELITLGIDVDGKRTYTSVELLNAERTTLETAEALSKANRHRVEDQYISQAIQTRTMNPEQEKAFRHIVEGGDVAGVIGYAGTGKSYTLGAVREAYEAQGMTVAGMALSGIAAEGLEHGSGIKSQTIHSQLQSWDNGFDLPGKKSIVIVDEAGMVGTRQMNRIMEHIKEHGAKLVLVGDNDQLQPIEAGGAFRGIVDRIGAATLDEVMRQETDWQKEATKQMAGDQAQVAQAIDTYDEHGNVKLSKSLDDSKKELIADWSKKVGSNGENIILAFRNKDVGDLNDMAREVFRGQGRLAGEETEIQTARGKRAFSVGDRVIFLKNEYSMKVKNGSLGTLEDTTRGAFTVKLDDGRTVAVDTHLYNNIDHGYAATIHKSQGVTVENAFVLATGHLDKHATYVAMSRHKESVSLYASIDENSRNLESFRDFGHMKVMLSRDRKKDLIVDYGRQRGVETDLTKIYKKEIYETTINSEKLRKVFSRVIVIDGSLDKENKIKSFREKAQGFAAAVTDITGVDKKDMVLKVERVSDEKYISLVEEWKREAQEKQNALTENKFLSKDEMAQAHWPPFPREEQGRLMTKFNAEEIERVRFADREESVQGRYLGVFDHKGVNVGVIQEGRGGEALINLVPFTKGLSNYNNQNVRYDIGRDKVTDRLQEHFKMIMTEQGTGDSFSKIVIAETGRKETVDEQKKSFADDMQRQLRLSSSKYDIKFEKLQREQIRKLQIDQSLSQGPKI